MSQFFCAESSRQSGVDIIGSAPTHEQYVLVECSAPWESYDLDSTSIPANLRGLGEEIYSDYDHFKTRILLIYNENLKQENHVKLIILRKNLGLLSSYSKQEFWLTDINQVAPLVKDYLAGNQPNAERVESPTRDILVCTHGSHDKCCAKYGNPFYRQALATVSDLSLSQVRVWQASHIGGHRFAPTAIDFPEGRYYGYLDSESFASILTRTGDIHSLKNVYRGWGILPLPAQILERNMILQYGWDWFKYKVIGQIIEQNDSETFNRVELTFETSQEEQHTYKADVIADENKTIYLKGSCNSEKESQVTQYIVENLVRT